MEICHNCTIEICLCFVLITPKIFYYLYKYVRILHNSNSVKKEDILSIYKEREKYG